MSNLREECGVFGIYSPETSDLARTAYYGLFALQHRGQESCGIVVNHEGTFTAHKDVGLVNDVFTSDILNRLGSGQIAVGHVRYGTTGSNDRNNAQPIVVNHIKGRIALAHNGNLVNSDELRHELELEGSIFHTTSDTEVISYIITKERLNAPSIEVAVERAMDRLRGAYSLVIMTPSKLIAVRDENGFRPLCYGKTEDGRYIVASESCALDSVGAAFIRDIRPGEIVIFDRDGVHTIETHCNRVPCSMCVFEYIYFARPDSVIDGCCVHTARMRAGAFLALEHRFRRMWSSAYRTAGLTPPSDTPSSLAFPMNSALSKTNTSDARLLRPVSKAARIGCVSNSIRFLRWCAGSAWS